MFKRYGKDQMAKISDELRVRVRVTIQVKFSIRESVRARFEIGLV